MTDILERAKAVDPEMLAVLNWGALRDLISELIAEVEAKQANNEYLQKMTEEAQGIMQESQLLLCKEANEAEQLQNEVERLRSDWRQEHATAETWKEDFKKMQKRLTDSELLRQAQYNQIAAKDARIDLLDSDQKRYHAAWMAAEEDKEEQAARIKELEAEVEAKNKQIRQDIIDKPPEEADWVADYHLLQSALDGPIIDAARKWHAAYRKAQNSNLMRTKEVKRLRSLNESLMENGNDLRTRCQKAEARIKKLEAELENLNGMGTVGYMLGYKKGGDGNKVLIDYIKRLEAAFLGATKEIVYAIHEGRDAPEGEDVYAEKEAREALERIKAGGKDEA
jgi:DNA repair exonuclease SbcCD ATPase subunit